MGNLPQYDPCFCFFLSILSLVILLFPLGQCHNNSFLFTYSKFLRVVGSLLHSRCWLWLVYLIPLKSKEREQFPFLFIPMFTWIWNENMRTPLEFKGTYFSNLRIPFSHPPSWMRFLKFGVSNFVNRLPNLLLCL